MMTAFQHLASSAPYVEAAPEVTPAVRKETAENPDVSLRLLVEPAPLSDEVITEAAPEVDPAVVFDDPQRFAPVSSSAIRVNQHNLLVATLRTKGGTDFEYQVRFQIWDE